MCVGILKSFPTKGTSFAASINTNLSLKFASSLMILGPMAMLVAQGAENSWMVLLPMLALGGVKLHRKVDQLSTKIAEG